VIWVLADGDHELGHRKCIQLSADSDLPALPRLVHRLLGTPAIASFRCEPFSRSGHVHPRRNRWPDGPRPRFKHARNVITAIARAQSKGADAVVVLVDRDRKPDAERGDSLRAGRDRAPTRFAMPCAVGQAVEAFDAWMIADAGAVSDAGGDAGKTVDRPEKEHTPKRVADDVFGTRGGTGLGPRYAAVANKVDLEHLARCCPEGFAPFAADVRERIAPIFRED